MKRAIFLVVILFGSLALFAQSEGPPIEIYGAYAHTSNYSVGQSGWLASANYDINHWLGAEADISGAYGTEGLGTVAQILPNVPNAIHSRMHMFNVGPRVTWRPVDKKYQAFGHLLFGYAHTNVSALGTGEGDNAFSWGIGGAGTYFFSTHWGGQVQFDEMRTNFFGHGDWHPRIGLGVVLRLGTK